MLCLQNDADNIRSSHISQFENVPPLPDERVVYSVYSLQVAHQGVLISIDNLSVIFLFSNKHSFHHSDFS